MGDKSPKQSEKRKKKAGAKPPKATQVAPPRPDIVVKQKPTK